MNDERTNPYAAPKAAVADVDAPAMERPPQVPRAVKLLWIGIAIGFVASVVHVALYDQPGLPKSAAIGVAAGTWTFALLIYLWIISAIGRGRNWARIVQLVFVILGALSSLTALVLPSQNPWFVWAAYVVQLGLHVYALVLLFSSPANEWYRAMKGR